MHLFQYYIDNCYSLYTLILRRLDILKTTLNTLYTIHTRVTLYRAYNYKLYIKLSMFSILTFNAVDKSMDVFDYSLLLS